MGYSRVCPKRIGPRDWHNSSWGEWWSSGEFLGNSKNPKKCQKSRLKIWSKDSVKSLGCEASQFQPLIAATKAWTDWCLCKAPQATVMMINTAVTKNKPPRQAAKLCRWRSLWSHCFCPDLTRNSTKSVTAQIVYIVKKASSAAQEQKPQYFSWGNIKATK